MCEADPPRTCTVFDSTVFRVEAAKTGMHMGVRSGLARLHG